MKKELVTLTKEEILAKKIELAQTRVSFTDTQTKAKQMRALKKTIAQSLAAQSK